MSRTPKVQPEALPVEDASRPDPATVAEALRTAVLAYHACGVELRLSLPLLLGAANAIDRLIEERDSDGVQAKDRDGEWTGVAMVSDPNDPMHRTPVSVANAKLIAAAPDILAALRYQLVVLNATPTDTERREASERIKAVIARAGGSAEG